MPKNLNRDEPQLSILRQALMTEDQSAFDSADEILFYDDLEEFLSDYEGLEEALMGDSLSLGRLVVFWYDPEDFEDPKEVAEEYGDKVQLILVMTPMANAEPESAPAEPE